MKPKRDMAKAPIFTPIVSSNILENGNKMLNRERESYI